MMPVLRRPGVRALISVVFAALAASKLVHFSGAPRYFLDADVYAVGGLRFLEGLPLYDGSFPTSSGVWLPFTYPPVAAVLFAPLAMMPLQLVFVLVAAATMGSLWWVLREVVAKLGGLRAADAGWLALALTAALLWFGPVHTTIGFGQVNVILMMLVAIDVLVVPPRWRGLLTGAAIAVKLTPAVFGLWFLLRRDWGGIARIAASAGGLTLLGHLAAPADSARYWTDTLANTGRIGGPMYASNQSIDAELWRLGLHTEDSGGGLWLALVLAALAVTVAVMLRLLRDGHPFLAVCANALFGLLASPISWSHHWVWVPVMVIAVTVLALRAPRRRGDPGGALPWIFIASGVVCFAFEPQALAPAEQGRELDWSAFWHVFGNAYLWWAVAALIMMWFLSRHLPSAESRLMSHSWNGWKAPQAR
ncbi:glycosyltransferase 87 family protein [Corynebacterium hansenii]|uniref:Glycosyltransferase 87 family protein n=1 Tax=Corynebacterium hansenii TaxID=394964 RepID=A0ABV7ZV56_9CORY|nr:glycosyltransferase 87 family protein [Corynebacterium hansenii]WJY99698.1 Polyprenol-phosphate-mannose-dependent alpha-(1-2)-phosphatidylinositol mannoside mannosyltransferase [Corynebacterium hansenii]